MQTQWFLSTLFFIFFFNSVRCQSAIKLLVVVESAETKILRIFEDVLPAVEKSSTPDKIMIEMSAVEVDRENVELSLQKVCSILYNGITIVLDITYTGWDKLRSLTQQNSIIYTRAIGSIIPYVNAVDDLLLQKNATDVALIFESERELNQSLYYLIGNSIIRLVVIDELSDVTVAKIGNMRPSPSYYVIYATTDKMENLFKTAIHGGLAKRDAVWNLVFTDTNYKNFRYISGQQKLNVTVGILSMNSQLCCHLMKEVSCVCPKDFQIYAKFLEELAFLLIASINQVQKLGMSVDPKVGKCETNSSFSSSDSNTTLKAFDDILQTNIATKAGIFDYQQDRNLISYKAIIDIEMLDDTKLIKLANWTKSKGLVEAPGQQIKPAKRFFRIGTAEALPWSTIKKNPENGEPMKNEDGEIIWEGYCIDFIHKLSQEMNFDYELVIPSDKTFGEKRRDGKWSGLIGDLAKGETDIAIGALTMTSEREEVIDFVAPYFEQSGILIVMRKPISKTSLFKFMTVLKIEVWLSIMGALTLTAIMIWILDKYSPYSARNNKRIYPYPCRDFTLKESFWFALTSFTPQGGGEAPKALSSRTLVAAYWLFVVLMLATFTANLAAFLTVERLQAQVSSLEQLARQSRINYTVVKDSPTHQYFENMKKAEEKLYNVWKEITLNSSSDQVEYRVWDYPIKEQYGHILQSIMAVKPVNNVSEGFQKVIDSDANFAFIHDSSEIKYEASRNCNLTEVGEIFAEQPYAVAVQQGSHLQEEISRKILDLQRNRYFESLTAKYWNASLKGKCAVADENEGITLESLGGVFIATLFGLALAIITLAGEVMYYRRKNTLGIGKQKEANQEYARSGEKIMQRITSRSKLPSKAVPTVAFGLERHQGPRPRVSHISVYPKNFAFKD